MAAALITDRVESWNTTPQTKTTNTKENAR